jgi:acyl-CoA thioesterase-1
MTSRYLLYSSLGLCFTLSACGDAGGREAPPRETPAAAAPTPPPAADTAGAHVVDDRPTVVFLGTSLTAGLGILRPEDTYVSRVAELADSAGLPIRVVNAGVSGATSADGLSRIGWVLRDSLDVMVLELGANDGLRGQDPKATEANLLAIIDSTRAHYPAAKIVVAGMEAPPNLGVGYTETFHAVFPTVAKETHAALIPFLLEGVAGVRSLNQADGIHPNPEGARIVAHNVWSVLAPVVRGLEPARPPREGP